MTRFNAAARRRIVEEVRAGKPCPLCGEAITPQHNTFVNEALERCPHCFRTYPVKKPSMGMTNPDRVHG